MPNPSVFFEEQLKQWPLAAENYKRLEQSITRTVMLDDTRLVLQVNPGRMASTAANTAATAIRERPCFLCYANRPPEQRSLAVPGEPRFTLLVNPFPVFPKHFTIIGTHQPQVLTPYIDVLFRLAQWLDDCVVFYNGPRCGASAPDHLHFQAGNKGIIPFQSDIDSIRKNHTKLILNQDETNLYQLTGLSRGGWLLEGKDEEALCLLTTLLMKTLSSEESAKARQTNQSTKGPQASQSKQAQQAHQTEPEEPMVNTLCWYDQQGWHLVLFYRKVHRPSCYFRQDQHQHLISPAAVEMGGLVIAARQEDFNTLTNKELTTILNEVSWDDETITRCSHQLSLSASANILHSQTMNSHHFNQEPYLEVGIVSGLELQLTFQQPYCLQPTEKTPYATDFLFEGDYTLTYENGHILFQGETYDQLRFFPFRPGSSFELHDVRIGIGFHWERTERQAFEGEIHFIVANDAITAINRVLLESYLTSVISSEMSANASLELLKAHAVISRSWLLSQVLQKGKKDKTESAMLETETERVKWYDREDHDLFDVCADDHCQRYQGITKASNPNVRLAIQYTRGQVLRSGAELCDARFSKCCGGFLEEFQYCWENTPQPYLKGKPDCCIKENNTKENKQTENGNPGLLPDLRQEQAASPWILGNPPSFCNTHDPAVLSQVLNNYDQETPDFYRWNVEYGKQEISELFARRSGMDVGEILELEPLERGVSGRIVRLRVVGTKKTVVIGKELEIRKALSNTHLYSSAFVVEKTATGFILHGAGWGHGVGLCQIGAAVMGKQGFSYREILQHYYPSTLIDNLYP